MVVVGSAKNRFLVYRKIKDVLPVSGAPSRTSLASTVSEGPNSDTP